MACGCRHCAQRREREGEPGTAARAVFVAAVLIGASVFGVCVAFLMGHR
jgi:hypothetical protein